jgi:hypothetical protein
MATPVLLPAGFGLLNAHGSLLALAYGGDSVWRDTETDQIVLHGRSPSFAECKVVLTASSRIAMTLDSNTRRRPTPHPLGVSVEQSLRVFANDRLIEIVTLRSFCPNLSPLGGGTICSTISARY